MHYLTGTADDIQALTDAVGFRDRFDPASNQFVHPAGVVFVTSSGQSIQLSARGRLYALGGALRR